MGGVWLGTISDLLKAFYLLGIPPVFPDRGINVPKLSHELPSVLIGGSMAICPVIP